MSSYLTIYEASVELKTSCEQVEAAVKSEKLESRTFERLYVPAEQRFGSTLIRRADLQRIKDAIQDAPFNGPRSDIRVRLYLIGTAYSEYIKVGKSTKPRDRLSTLQTGSVKPLVLLWYGEQGSGIYEAAIHESLKSDRLHGEWFSAWQVRQAMFARGIHDAAWSSDVWIDEDYCPEGFSRALGVDVRTVTAVGGDA